MKLPVKIEQVCVLAAFVLLISSLSVACTPEEEPRPLYEPNEIEIKLPDPKYESDVSIERALGERRSVRDYTGQSISLQQVSQLLWSAQGVTDPRGLRTAPSAGATYPLETYIVAGNVEKLAAGVYRYDPSEHKLEQILSGDIREELAEAALGQSFLREGAIVVVFAAIYERTTARYGDRGVRYVHMEAGHASQNIYLQAAALELGTVVVGAFHDDKVKELLRLPDAEQPLYLMPVGSK